ncbi:MAG TPA: hypothetical protein VIS56_01365 [Candidatus Saccharimonadales bacterium]
MKRFWLGIGMFIAFFAGFYLTGRGETAQAYAGTIYGRSAYHGYFGNVYDDAGTYVFPRYYDNGGVMEALPTNINTADEFINFIIYTQYDYDNGGGTSPQEKTGAAFIINTMLGRTGANGKRTLSAQDLDDWQKLVRTAAAQGHVNWRTNFSYTVNSFYQGCGTSCGTNDDAFYSESGTKPSIVFRDANNTIAYVVKWECANPVGGTFRTLQPAWEGVGRTVVGDGVPDPGDTTTSISTRPGDTVHFDHYVKNIGPGQTSPDNISFAILDGAGATLQPGQDSGSYAINQEKLVDSDENIVVPLNATPGTQYCRKVLWDWKNSWGDGDGTGTSGTGPVACATVIQNYSLAPNIVAKVDGVVSDSAEPGQNVTFEYSVTNNDNGISQSTSCTIYGLTKTGYYTPPTPHDTTSDVGFVQPAHGCPRNFPGMAKTDLVNETVSNVVLNRTYCRTLVVNPATPGGPAADTEVCVRVGNKPYARVYGGDVAIGGGLEITPDSNDCSQDGSASVVGWNRQAAGDWAGAGVQFAAYAMGRIFDTATSLGNSAGASPPTALSFANTSTSAASGNFGGAFNKVACVPDYYDESTPLPSTSTVPAVSGSYRRTGDWSLAASTVPVGVRATVYVDGNLFIGGNITYAGGWTNASDIPMLRIVVLGDIFIGNDVDQLDGMYVAQQDGSAKGIIYTCALASAPYTPMVLDGTLLTQCDDTKLTVNGALVARQIQLLRTVGTKKNATASENASSANIAEAFNYGPALWISQPPSAIDTADYDAITSLPPIL